MRLAAVIVPLLMGCTATAGTVPATRPTTQPVSLVTDDAGQLRVRIDADGPFSITGRSLELDCERTAGEYELCRPAGHFDGRISLKFSPGVVRLSAWRYTYVKWQVTAFLLEQSPGNVRAEFTIRTPAGQPDITIVVEARHLADLLDDRPDLRTMLDIVLVAMGSDPWDAGEFVRTIKESLQVEPWVCVKVEDALELCGARSPRLRQVGETELTDLGWPAAVYLRRRDLRTLSIEQRRIVGVVLADWPGN